MKTLGTLQFAGETLTLKSGLYRHGTAPAVCLLDEDGSPYTTCSVNLPEYALEPHEVLMKTWGENEALRAPLLETGFFEDTGKRAATGFCIAEVWRFSPQAQTALAG